MIASFGMSNEVVTRLLWLNVHAALLAVLIGAACWLGARWIAPRWRSLLWMLVFVRLIMPAGPSSVLSLENLFGNFSAASPRAPAITSETVTYQPVSQRPSNTADNVAIRNPSTDRVASFAQVPITRSDSAPTVLEFGLVFWLLIAALLVGRVGWLRFRLSRQLECLERITHWPTLELARSTAKEAGLARAPHMMWEATGSSPAVFGWWSPVLLLPRDSTILDESRFRIVLLHEFRHIRSADTLLTWAPRLICCIFWFNPLLWWASRRWHEERELACDEWVLQHIGADQQRTYLEVLITIAIESQRVPSLVFTASVVSSRTLLEKRIVAMKRLQPPTWTGVIAGLLVTLLIGAIGLTDAVRAEDGPATQQTPPSIPAPGDLDATSSELARQASVADSPAQSAPTLHPNVTFAQHVILWEGKEILSADELKERLIDMRKKLPVKPYIHVSLGYCWSRAHVPGDEPGFSERADATLAAVFDLLGGENQWSALTFTSRRGSGAVDHIRNPDDLRIDPQARLTGQVVFRGEPAQDAQVVILPLGEPAHLYLRNGMLSIPRDEIWYETNEAGMFEANPASLHFDPVTLFGEGKYLTVILHEQGYRVINGQLAASDATYELIPWTNVSIDVSNLNPSDHVELSIQPTGVHEKFPGIVPLSLRDRDEKMLTAKLPQGSGGAYYRRENEDGTRQHTDFWHRVEITADGPKRIVLPAGEFKS